MLQSQTVRQSTLELLKELMQIPELNAFFLVGGTNLALKLGHRLSVDLDLFTDNPFDTEVLHGVLEERYSDLIVIIKNKSTLLGYIQGVKVDFALYRYGLLYPVEEIEGIRLASLPDIAAMKLNAVSRRGVKKDYWDIAELLNRYTIEEMLYFFKEKHKSTDIGHIIRSLVYFEDADKSETPESLKKMTWGKVKKTIETNVREYIKTQTKG